MLGEYAASPTSPSKHYLTWPSGPDNSLISETAWFGLATGWGNAHGHIWFISTKDGKPQYLAEFDFVLSENARQVWQLPVNTDQIGLWIQTDGDNPVGWSLEVQGK